MQGLGVGGVVGNWKGQPAIVKVSNAVTKGAPPAFAVAFALMIETVPPCGHFNVLAVVRLLPGISTYLQRAAVDLHRLDRYFNLADASLIADDAAAADCVCSLPAFCFHVGAESYL